VSENRVRFTPGPWGYVHHKGLDQHLVGATLENVAIIEDRHGNVEANARLIAAAPDSYNANLVALGALQGEWPDEMDARDASLRTPGMVRLAKDTLKLAIKKATGEGE